MLGPLLAMPSGQGLNMTLLAILKVNGANWLLVLEKNWSCGKMFLLLTRYHYWLDNIIYYQPRPLCTWQPPKKNKKNVVQILTITIALGIDLSKRLFLVQHGFSSSWTPLPCHKHGQKEATNCCLQEAIVNGLWTLNRFERVYGIWVFPCTGTGLTATKYCLEMGLNRFERQFLGQGIPNGISQIPEV